MLRTIEDETPDIELAGLLRGMVDENLGSLAIESLTDEQREEIVRIVETKLLGRAERDLPPALANRDGVIRHIRDLVRLCYDS